MPSSSVKGSSAYIGMSACLVYFCTFHWIFPVFVADNVVGAKSPKLGGVDLTSWFALAQVFGMALSKFVAMVHIPGLDARGRSRTLAGFMVLGCLIQGFGLAFLSPVSHHKHNCLASISQQRAPFPPLTHFLAPSAFPKDWTNYLRIFIFISKLNLLWVDFYIL